MEVLAGRVILTPREFDKTRSFYENTLGLRVFREYGFAGEVAGVVLFMGGGHLELSARKGSEPVTSSVRLWLQVPDLAGEQRRLLADEVTVTKPAGRMPWGLDEMWIEDPDGNEIRLVEVPDDHPMRRRM